MLASCYSYQSSFNPRICKRCDGNWIKSREYFNVSIHASVKDATLIFLILVILTVFQSTHL